MALSDALNRQKRHNEKLLSNLERKYDKKGEAQRQYAKALEDINHLLTNKVIDYPYALDLRDAAKETYETFRQKQLDELERQRELLNPIPDYGNIISTILAIVVVIWFVIPLLF